MAVEYSLSALIREIQKAKSEMVEINNQINDLNKLRYSQSLKIQQLEKKIAKAKTGDVIISEHAMLRYLERFVGIEIKKHEKRILDDGLKSEIKSINGNGKLAYKGMVYVVKENVIVSIIEQNKNKTIK